MGRGLARLPADRRPPDRLLDLPLWELPRRWVDRRSGRRRLSLLHRVGVGDRRRVLVLLLDPRDLVVLAGLPRHRARYLSHLHLRVRKQLVTANAANPALCPSELASVPASFAPSALPREWPRPEQRSLSLPPRPSARGCAGFTSGERARLIAGRDEARKCVRTRVMTRVDVQRESRKQLRAMRDRRDGVTDEIRRKVQNRVLLFHIRSASYKLQCLRAGELFYAWR